MKDKSKVIVFLLMISILAVYASNIIGKYTDDDIFRFGLNQGRHPTQVIESGDIVEQKFVARENYL